MQQIFALLVGRLPSRKWHPLKRRWCEMSLAETPGVIDWMDDGERGTLVFFGTRTHAERAMQAMKHSGNPVGDVILTGEADYETHTIRLKGPLEQEEPCGRRS